jgi:hypothetical protein
MRSALSVFIAPARLSRHFAAACRVSSMESVACRLEDRLGLALQRTAMSIGPLIQALDDGGIEISYQ